MTLDDLSDEEDLEVAILAEPESETAFVTGNGIKVEQPKDEQPAEETLPETSEAEEAAEDAGPAEEPEGPESGQVAATEAAMKLAQQADPPVNLAEVKHDGPRITKPEVQEHLKHRDGRKL